MSETVKLFKLYSEEINQLQINTTLIKYPKYTKGKEEYYVVVSEYDEEDDVYEQRAIDITGLEELKDLLREWSFTSVIGVYSKGNALTIEYSADKKVINII